MFKSFRAPVLTLGLILFSLTIIDNAIAQRSAPATETSASSESDLLKNLQWRSVGPFRGGRVTAVTGVASQPMVYYFGGTGGGVWKSVDGGINWEPVSDGSVFSTGSVGATAL